MEQESIINLKELEYLPRPAAMGKAPEGFAFLGKVGESLQYWEGESAK
ncbi:hypothetical protein H0X32_00195 [Patescibacteria group bacterium]|nr:hypothetical protein [Patescibacteria group bacterium]